MSGGLRWFRVRWPRHVDAEQLVGATAALAAVRKPPIVLEAVGVAGRVEHRIGVPEPTVGFVRRQLTSALTGVGLELLESRPVPDVRRATAVMLSTRRRLLNTASHERAARLVLSALAGVRTDEVVVLQWVLGGVLSPAAVAARPGVLAESWPAAIAEALSVGVEPLDADARTALRAKRASHGWRAAGRLAVRAGSAARERQLLAHVYGALRSVEAPDVSITLRNSSARAVAQLRAWRYPLRVNLAELALLAAWPVGDIAVLPVSATRHRMLPVPKAIPRRGRVIGDSDAASARRPVALSVEDSRLHSVVTGPTGTGKSELLLNLVLHDIAAGFGTLVVEPKGDLIDDILARLPRSRWDDVVVLDPAETARPVGFNPLAGGRRSAELAADQLLGVFHSLYRDSWGPRLQEILGAALLTLARTPGMSLAALPLLLGNDAFRARLVSKLDDPLGLGPFWAAFNAMSPAERTTATASILNKVRPYVTRPGLRHIIGQAEATWSLGDALWERKIVLVSLGRSSIGPEAAALLGSLVVADLAHVIQERHRVARDERTPASVYLDEFASYLHLGVDLADVLMLSRSTGVAWTIAHQHLKQLPGDLSAAVAANARSKVVFQPEHHDAGEFAKRTGGVLDAADFEALPVYHAYAQLVAGGAVQAWCSLATRKAPDARHDPAAVRARSAQRYGRPAAEIDAEIEALTRPGGAGHGGDDLGPKPRTRGAR